MRYPAPGQFSMEKLFGIIRDILSGEFNFTVNHCRFRSQGLFRRLADMLIAISLQGDINHVTGDVHYLTIFLGRRRTILTIHDCVTLERLSGLRYSIYRFFWYWLPVRRSAAITVVSESTKQELQRHLGKGNWPITVIPNPVSPEFANAPRVFNADFPTILQVGTTNNKNVERIAAALNGVKCKMVIVGQLQPAQLDALHKNAIVYENCFGITQAELVEQYRQCDIVMFASLYEGFGLPILEAQATGRPVITSNCYSMPEVGGEGACYIDPYSASDIRQGVHKIVSDVAYREHIVSAGHINVEKYRAVNIARQYAELYRRVYRGQAA
jgi:glycosyltransferase involved in cell wall biosynthesis